jgi:hypothetical protein
LAEAEAEAGLEAVAEALVAIVHQSLAKHLVVDL